MEVSGLRSTVACLLLEYVNQFLLCEWRVHCEWVRLVVAEGVVNANDYVERINRSFYFDFH